MPSVVLVNDTSLYARHFGCQLAGQTIREQLARVDIELIASFPRKLNLATARQYFDRADLIILNAEGTLHDGRHTELLELAQTWPSVLINGVFQNNGHQSALNDFLYVAMRESFSAKEIRKQDVACKVVPDLLFASAMLRSVPEMNRDIELGITDNVLNQMGGFSPSGTFPYQVVEKIARCQKLCAGRFHAAITAAVLGVPFSTWDSNTWKTRGIMRDMGLQHLHFETQTEAIQNAPVTLDPKVNEFVMSARDRIEKMFNAVAKIAHRINLEKSRSKAG